MPKGHGSRFPRMLARAVAEYLAGPTQAAAAKRLGIAPGTMSAWVNDPTFQAMLATAQAYRLQQELERLAVPAGRYPRIHRTTA